MKITYMQSSFSISLLTNQNIRVIATEGGLYIRVRLSNNIHEIIVDEILYMRIKYLIIKCMCEKLLFKLSK